MVVNCGVTGYGGFLMFDIERSMAQAINRISGQLPTVIFAEPLDPRIISAAAGLVRFARFVFPASETQVREAAEELGGAAYADYLDFLFSRSLFFEPDSDPALLDMFAREYLVSGESGTADLSFSQARERVSTPSLFSIMAVRLGLADIVAGGLESSPKQFFRPCLALLADARHPFEVGIFVLPDHHPPVPFEKNVAIFADVGVTATMTPDALVDIAAGACRMARDLLPTDFLPTINGAIVSYSTKGTDEGPSVELVRQAAALLPARLRELRDINPIYSAIKIDAELQASCALSREAAEWTLGRAMEAEGVYGRTNVLIAPNLDLGNFLYHIYSLRYPDSRKFPQIGGVGHHAVDFARDSSAEDVRLGILATILQLHKSEKFSFTPNDYFFKRYKILAINPGSTSTKLSWSEGERTEFTIELRHSKDELTRFPKVADQYEFRRDLVLAMLRQRDADISSLDAVVGRGGLIHPVESGTYAVNQRMIEDLHAGVAGEHASNLGGILAAEIGKIHNVQSFIVDPVVVDEVDPRFRVTGMAAITRRVRSHALNQLATAKRYAEEQGTFYHRLNLIVAHLGGGITVGAHYRGRYIAVNDGLGGEGPFSPERAGSLPAAQLIDLCFSGKYSKAEIEQMNIGQGGLVSLLGTADFLAVEQQVLAGEPHYTFVFDAMAYQVACEITSRLPAFAGETVDQILLTGGLARCASFVSRIKQRLSGAGIPVSVYPGENELDALRDGVLRVLQGKEPAKRYEGRTSG